MPYKLKSLTQCPPGGFHYRQGLTGWENDKVSPSSVWDFHLLCRELQKHRISNPKYKLNTSMPAIIAEVDAKNAERVAAIPGGDLYVVSTDVPTSFHQAPVRALQAVVAAARAINTGADNISDWLDSEIPPVSPEVSERRAATCVKCPLNGMGSLSRWFTIPAASLITKRLEKLHTRKLSTSFDNQLGTCEACLCRNQLKVHEPLELVLKHTSEEVRARLDANCWVIAEAK
jgi:hypothetical protein